MANPINIKFPLVFSPNGAFATNSTTINAVRDNLKILLLTNHGERVIQADFGANLRSIIFEQGTDTRQKIIDLINIAVDKWMPFVIIQNIQISLPGEDKNLLPQETNVKIFFAVGKESGVLEQTIRNNT